MQYQHILHLVFAEPWAILPEQYTLIRDLIRFRAEGGRLTPDEIQERIGAATVRQGAARGGSIAVLPLYGVIAQRMNLLTQMSGGTSTELYEKAFQQAIADPQVSAVVLDIDSPGGSVFGVQELADTIYRARNPQKPIIAVANSMAASAAYWIASAADEIVVTPSGEVGSIGVLSAHEDISGMEESLGVKTTLISAGKKKTWNSPYAPLSEDAKADIQERVNQYYHAFVGAVARGRGVRPSQVRSGFGEGGMVGATDATTLGMADRVQTLEGVLQRLSGRSSRQSGARSELEPIDLAAVDEILPESVPEPAGANLDLRLRLWQLTGR